MDILKTYSVDYNKKSIRFIQHVYADDFFCDCCHLQTFFENIEHKTLVVDLTKTCWFDTLSLCHLFMFMEKAKIEFNVEFLFKLKSNSDMENCEKQFFSFLYHTGFYSHMQKLGSIEYCGTPDNIGNLFAVDYSDVHECIYEFRTISEENQINLEILAFENVLAKSLSGRIDSDSTSYAIHKAVHFLRESLENIFSHAYKPDDSLKICCIIVNIVKSDISLNTRKYEDTYTKRTPYTNISLFNEKNEYIEIYIADLGMGLRKSFLVDPDTKDSEITDENILEYILTEGQRSRRKMKRTDSTQHGGLFNLMNTFYSDGDRLGFKADSRWLFGFKDFARINNDIPQHSYDKLMHGFAVVGFISWRSNSDNYGEGYYISNENEETKNTSIYLNRNPWMTSSYMNNLTIYDCRLSTAKPLHNNSAHTLVLFPANNMSKDDIIKPIFDLRASTVIIADIPKTELKNYYMILKNSKYTFGFIKKIILISLSNAVAIFVNTGKGLVLDSKEMTTYADTIKATGIAESLISFRQWQKTYDSEIIWSTLSRYNQFGYINAEIDWNGKSLRGYLDFSQMILIPECRDICIQQLFHVQSHNKPIYFRSLDRFTDDICEHVNNIMGNNPASKIIWIGSVYVSGMSRNYGQERAEHENEYYFFQHADANTKTDVLKMLEWSTVSERLNEWFPQENYKDKQYTRVGDTSFLADAGSTFWLSKHYLDSKEIFHIFQDQAYLIFQNNNKIQPPILSLGHYDKFDSHDLFYLNPLTMFENDMAINNFKETLLSNSYDFLITQFLGCLHARPDLRKIRQLLNEKLSSIVFEATNRKLHEYYQSFSRRDDMQGLIIYYADYETSRIIEYFRELLNDEMRENIIPVIPVERNSFSTMLNLSPLLIEKLEAQINNIKDKNYKETGNANAKVTIFVSTIQSAQLRKQLKHIIYRLGATQVNSLSLIDRQHFAMGTYGKTGSHSSFLRLDVPVLGSSLDCQLCLALSQLKIFRDEIRTELLYERIEKVRKNWCETKISDTYNGVGARIKEIPIPDIINREIQKKSELMGFSSINITTDFGLAVFCVENFIITLSLEFLEVCLNCDDLSDDIKTLLISSYLLLANKMQMSETHTIALLYRLSDLIRHSYYPTDNTALALLSIIAQSRYYSKRLFDIIIEAKAFDSNNNDYLLLLLWLQQAHMHADHEFNMRLQCHFVTHPNKLELIYNILLYTELAYKQSHRRAFSQIYYSTEELPGTIYLEAKEYACKLCSIYEAQISPSLFSNSIFTNDRKKAMITLLSEFIEQLNKGELQLARDKLITVINDAKVLNTGLFIKSGDEKEIEKFIFRCDQKAKEKTNKENGKILVSIGKYTQKKDEATLPWFYAFSDVAEELVNLISDIYLYSNRKIPNIFEETSSNEEFDGIIKVLFHRGWVSIHFYNIMKYDVEIEEIISIKKSKFERPSILVFKEFQKKISNISSQHEECLLWEYVDTSFPNFIRNQEHLLMAEMKIPYVDMGSSFRLKE